MITPRIYGQSDRAPLILLHPGGMLHNVWQPYIRVWSQRFYIFAPDLLIDSASPTPLHALALETQTWLDQNKIKQVDVIGASLGANVALHLAIENPARIKHLVLDSGQAGTPTPPMPLIALTKILRGMFAVMPQSLITRGLMSQFKAYAPDDRALIRADITRLGKYGFVEAIEAHLSHHVADKLHHITAATLILEGSGDMLTKQGVGAALERGLANAQRKTISGAGHVTFLRHPEVFRQHVNVFLAQAAPEQRA